MSKRIYVNDNAKKIYVNRRAKQMRIKRWHNRVCAILLLLIGCLPLWLEQDATALILFSIFAIVLWFQRPDL